MKYLPTTALLVALSSAVNAIPLNALGDLARRATFNNAANAADYVSRATSLAPGSYTIRAVTSGNWVTYRGSPAQSFWANSAATYGSPISLESNADGLSPNGTRFMPTMSNYKCVSSQWDGTYDGGANWAGVLYICAVGSGPVHVGLRPAKQWFYLISTSGLPQGPSPYYVIPVDHVLDMKTRGWTDCIRTTNGASSMCMDVLDASRADQIWDIQPYSVNGVVPTTTAAVKPATTTTAAVKPTTTTAKPLTTTTTTVVVVPPTTTAAPEDDDDDSAATPTTSARGAGITPVPVNFEDLFSTKPVGITPVANPKLAKGRVAPTGA